MSANKMSWRKVALPLAVSPSDEFNPLLPGHVWPVLVDPLYDRSGVSMDDSNF